MCITGHVCCKIDAVIARAVMVRNPLPKSVEIGNVPIHLQQNIATATLPRQSQAHKYRLAFINFTPLQCSGPTLARRIPRNDRSIANGGVFKHQTHVANGSVAFRSYRLVAKSIRDI